MEKIKQELKNFFKDINFKEEGHKYDVKGQTLKYSVSGLIKFFSPYFDTENISLGTAKKYGKTQEQVLQEWEEEKNKACDKGNVAHLFGENYMLDRSLKPSTGLEKAIVKFWGDLPKHIVPTIPELQMYHKEYLFAGTADVPLYNTITKKHIIADYKTNKDLFKNFNNQKLLTLFQDLLDCPFSKYQIQLSFYQILMEQVPEVEVSHRKIIWLKDDGSYLLYDTIDYTDRLKNFLKNTRL